MTLKEFVQNLANEDIEAIRGLNNDALEVWMIETIMDARKALAEGKRKEQE